MTRDSDRQERLLAAYQEGNFLEIVYQEYLAERDDRDLVAEDVAALHNKGRIDAVSAFSCLENSPNEGPDFFLTRHVFEKALPLINAPVVDVMSCVQQLYLRAGHDLAAGTIMSEFVNFCAAATDRPKDALMAIEENPDGLADMLPSLVASGSQHEPDAYLAEIARLSENANFNIRHSAIFSYAVFSWPDDMKVPDAAIDILERRLTEEQEDCFFAVIVKAASRFARQDSSTIDRIFSILDKSIENGGELTLHATSEQISSGNSDLPEIIEDLFIDHLKAVDPKNKGTIDKINFGIQRLFKSNKTGKAIDLLEQLILRNEETLSINAFDSTKYEILRNEDLLSKFLTRWFLTSESALCKAIMDIVGSAHGEKLHIKVDVEELEPVTPERIVFLARKATGYLFMKPVTVASIIVSLMKLANKETANYLAELLFNPLLRNYPGKTQEFLKLTAKEAQKDTKRAINKALKSLKKYLGRLHEVPDLPALHPPQAHREIYLRRMNEAMSESMKAAEKDSVFLNLVSKSVLLYGRKSITYVYGGSGEPSRTEIPMAAHSFEMEFPRMETLNSFELDYMLRVFRVERFKQ